MSNAISVVKVIARLICGSFRFSLSPRKQRGLQNTWQRENLKSSEISVQIRKIIVNNVILGVLFPAHPNFVRLREVFFEWKMKNLSEFFL